MVKVVSGGSGLGSLLTLGLVGAAVLLALSAKDLQRYLKLRNM